MGLDSKSLGRPRFILMTLLPIAAFTSICRVSPEYSRFLIRLHEVLTDLTGRGQSTVELFAPMSTILAASPAVLAWVSCLVWPLVGALISRTWSQGHDLVTTNTIHTWAAPYIVLLCGSTYVWSATNILSLLNDVADALLILALLASTSWQDRPQWLRALLFFGLGEALILTSFAPGCNELDAAIAYLSLLMDRGRRLFQKVADTRHSAVYLGFECMVSLAIALMVCPLSAMLLGGALLPMSESASGGNYNLRFFSASMRRDLIPFPAVHRPSSQGSPHLGLHNGMSYTLYLPKAGFLWSDSLSWTQRVPESLLNSTAYHHDENGNLWSVDSSHRVLFQDKFVEHSPWQVQVYAYSSPSPVRDSLQTIRSGQTVLLYDLMANRYLCVIPGERVISEAGYFDTDESVEQSVSRIRVGWAVYYDQTVDDGIRLYNHKNQCNLATTFRSLPGPGSTSIQTNDTVLRILNLELEASCTISASDASSRLFMIDSEASDKPPGTAPNIANVGYLRRAIEYLAARHRLGHFRSHYNHLQEEQIGPATAEIEGKTRAFDLSSLDILMCSLYLLIWVLGRLTRQQRWLPVGFSKGFQTGGFFVLCHFCGYYL